MQSVKARKQGNATVVTIPSSIKVPLDTEFYVLLKEDKSITFIPKVANFYEASDVAPETLWQGDLLDDDELCGREML